MKLVKMVTHDYIDELLADNVLSNNDIINLTLDVVVGLEGGNDKEEKPEEKPNPLTAKLIREDFQLCSELNNHFLINDPNSELQP